MAAHGVGDIEVFIWDHNKERLFERVRDMVDDSTGGMVAGAAFHWYSGDHFDALDLVRQQYPNLKLITSESCIEYRFLDKENIFDNASRLAHELIGDLNHGTNAFYDWNILLDEKGGPNHAGNWCHAVFLYDKEKRVLRPQLLQKYYHHFASFIAPGAKRIGASKYTAALEMTAFLNPNNRIAVVMFNCGEDPIPVNLRLDGQLVKFTVEGRTIATGLIDVNN